MEQRIELLEQRLEKLENMLFFQKEVFTLDEAALFLGISKSYLYKLTSSAAIPHYKPTGKVIYFIKKDLLDWVYKNGFVTDKERVEAAEKSLRDYFSSKS